MSLASLAIQSSCYHGLQEAAGNGSSDCVPSTHLHGTPELGSLILGFLDVNQQRHSYFFLSVCLCLCGFASQINMEGERFGVQIGEKQKYQRGAASGSIRRVDPESHQSKTLQC